MLNQHVRMRKLLNQSVDFKANPPTYMYHGAAKTQTNRYALGGGYVSKNADIIEIDYNE